MRLTIQKVPAMAVENDKNNDSNNNLNGIQKENEMMETSAELVERTVSEYESSLIGYARTIVHDLDRDRDVVQDTYIRLYQQDVSKVRDGLKSWLFTVCRNRALDILRKEKRLVSVEDEVLAAEDSGVATPCRARELLPGIMPARI